jgi:hypothetical protein
MREDGRLARGGWLVAVERLFVGNVEGRRLFEGGLGCLSQSPVVEPFAAIRSRDATGACQWPLP